MKTKLLPSREQRWKELFVNYTDRPSTLVLMYNLFDNFLKQAPELYMFVPCEKILIDNVTDPSNPEYHYELLEKPDEYDEYLRLGQFGYKVRRHQIEKCKQYQQALDRVIFDGFEVIQEEVSKNRKWIYISVENERKLVIFFNGELYKPAGAQTLADLSGKVYLNINGQKQAGIWTI